jgi:diguanylate cyclase (GGDEF)-like protein
MEKSTKRSILFFDSYDRFRFLQGIQWYLWASKGRFLFERGTTAIDEVIKRPADMAPRYGGEEFALILSETSSKGAVSLAERLRKPLYDFSLEHKTVLLSLEQLSVCG